MLTSALILCNFYYASASWFSGLSKKKQVKILGITKQSCEIFTLSSLRPLVGANEFKCVKMLPVNYRVDQLMFNIYQRSYPFSPRVRHWHSIVTRSREYDVVVPRVQGPGSSTFAFTVLS